MGTTPGGIAPWGMPRLGVAPSCLKCHTRPKYTPARINTYRIRRTVLSRSPLRRETRLYERGSERRRAVPVSQAGPSPSDDPRAKHEGSERERGPSAVLAGHVVSIESAPVPRPNTRYRADLPRPSRRFARRYASGSRSVRILREVADPPQRSAPTRPREIGQSEVPRPRLRYGGSGSAPSSHRRNCSVTGRKSSKAKHGIWLVRQ